MQRLKFAARESMDRDMDIVFAFHIREPVVQIVRQCIQLFGSSNEVESECVRALKSKETLNRRLRDR